MDSRPHRQCVPRYVPRVALSVALLASGAVRHGPVPVRVMATERTDQRLDDAAQSLRLGFQPANLDDEPGGGAMLMRIGFC